MQKNEEFILEIIDNGFQGEGIAKLEDYTIFIPNCIKGEKVKAKILKIKEKIAFAKVIQIIESSKDRTEIDCKYYEKCGGCNFRHFEYQKSLDIKKNATEITLKKALLRDIKIDEVIGMENPIFYRNKLQYPVGINKERKYSYGNFC